MFGFGKNKEKEMEEVVEESRAEQKKAAASFLFGVHDVFRLVNSKNVIVIGRLKGTVHVGDVASLSNPGADDDVVTKVTVAAIETADRKREQEATDCDVTIYIEDGSQCPVRKCSVLFAGEHSEEDVHNTYINALGDVFVLKQKMVFSDEDLKQFSIVDCAEIWRLFSWFQSAIVQKQSEEEKQENLKRLDRLAKALCEKIMGADEIYCLFNKITGEPHMLSRTVKREEGYLCTPPNILIFTKSYVKTIKEAFNDEKFDIQRIENGEDKKGIYNFFGNIFYLNGACGVEVLSEQSVIAANMLVPAPDYTGVNPRNIPVTNPDLVRWMLLLGQMGDIQGEEKELIYKLYYRFMSKEMVKAKLLIPIQNADMPKADGEGKATLTKETPLRFPTMEGKDGRRAVRVFTDWRRLRMVYDDKWGGMVQNVEGLIDVFDCAINTTQFPRAGGYVSREMFENMKKVK